LAKLQVGKIANWQNGKLVKCQFDKMAKSYKASWIIENINEMALSQIWQVGKMPSRQNDTAPERLEHQRF
jgi:hypothetical protein